MKVRFTAAARRELADAIEYYEGRQTHLGERFLAAVEATAERIKRHPRMWASVTSDIRRCLVPGFPFALFYRVSESDIHILAVAFCPDVLYAEATGSDPADLDNDLDVA